MIRREKATARSNARRRLRRGPPSAFPRTRRRASDRNERLSDIPASLRSDGSRTYSARVPRPYGSDRVEERPGGRVRLSCPCPKEWTPRRPAERGLALHPGTAVRWEDEIWEVVVADETAAGTCDYELAPWDDQHAIRVLAPYDAASEAARAADRRDVGRRKGARRVVLLLAPVAGLLPGRVQERFETELGLRATTLTLASIVAPIAVGFFALVLTMASGFAPGLRMEGPAASPLLPLLAYLFPESLVRFLVSMAQGRPIGSLLGVPLYLLGRAAGWVPPPDGTPASSGPTPGSHAPGDRYLMIEPLLSFLPVDDQLSLRDGYGFSPVTWGKRTAWFLLFYPGLTAPAHAFQLLSGSGGLRSLFFLGLAVGLSVEQVRRLRRLSLGQAAPSVLGPLVAPFARPLLVSRRGPWAP